MTRAKKGLLYGSLVVAGLIVLSAIGLYLGLKRGLSVEGFAFGPLSVAGVEARLDGRIAVEIDSLSVALDRPESSPDHRRSEVDFDQLRRYILVIGRATGWFQRIAVRNLIVGDARGDFLYQINAPGRLSLSGPKLAVEVGIRSDAEHLHLELVRLSAMAEDLQVQGQVSLNLGQRRLTADLQCLVAQTLPVQLTIDADRKQLSFLGHGTDAVSDIAPIVEMLGLSPVIAPWIADYLEGDRFELVTISGTLPYAKPAAILQSLHAVARVEKVSYTFDQDLAPILATEADVVFERGVLHVYPGEGTFYGQSGGDSRVLIDFNQGRALLTAIIRTQAQASGGILTLLQHYGIPFPLVQEDGLTDVDLTLEINLKTIEIGVNGRFQGAGSIVAMGGQYFSVPAFDVTLADNTRLKFTHLELGLDDWLALSLRGEYDASRKRGDLLLAVPKLQWPPSGSTLTLLQADETGPVVGISLRADSHRLHVPETRWRYGPREIAVGEFVAPVHADSLGGRLPATDVSVGRLLDASVEGGFTLYPVAADLAIELRALRGENLRLAQPSAKVSLRLGTQVDLATARPLKLSFRGLPTLLQPTRASYGKGRLRITQSGLQIEDTLSTELRASINLTRGLGRIELDDLMVGSASDRDSLLASDALGLNLSRGANEYHIDARTIGLSGRFYKDGSWSLRCPDLKKLTPYSEVLQGLDLSAGEFELRATQGSDRLKFSGSMHYPYALLMKRGKPTNDYHFKGWLDSARAQITVNDTLRVNLARTIELNSRGIAYNLAELMRLANDRHKRRQASQPAKPNADKAQAGSDLPSELRFRLNARDSYLWMDEDRRILADDLLIHVADGRAKIKLRHRVGLAAMELEGNRIGLLGQGFGQNFIDSLLADMAVIEGGTLKFRAQGTLDEIDAVVAVNDALLKDYKQLNNMLAFINTVPGLLTFNPPSYDKLGLQTSEMAASFVLSGRVMNIKSMNIDSDELDIRGTGVLDFEAGTTDMTFNLVTGAKKSIARIPLLGFILTGGTEKPSITLRVWGDTQDPEVKSTAFKEVATYPFAVLARTILLPVHLVQTVQGAGQDEEAEEAPTP